jgi:4-hydroxy-tetrahydrodipicolinate reductase
MKIGIVGCAGRMGRILVQEVAKTKGCQLAGGTEGPNNVALGEDVAVYAGLPEYGFFAKVKDLWDDLKD